MPWKARQSRLRPSSLSVAPRDSARRAGSCQLSSPLAAEPASAPGQRKQRGCNLTKPARAWPQLLSSNGLYRASLPWSLKPRRVLEVSAASGLVLGACVLNPRGRQVFSNHPCLPAPGPSSHGISGQITTPIPKELIADQENCIGDYTKNRDVGQRVGKTAGRLHLKGTGVQREAGREPPVNARHLPISIQKKILMLRSIKEIHHGHVDGLNSGPSFLRKRGSSTLERPDSFCFRYLCSSEKIRHRPGRLSIKVFSSDSTLASISWIWLPQDLTFSP